MRAHTFRTMHGSQLPSQGIRGPCINLSTLACRYLNAADVAGNRGVSGTRDRPVASTSSLANN
jgi:hypothetical protein